MRHREKHQLRQTRVFQLVHQTRALAKEREVQEAAHAERTREQEESARQEERLQELTVLYDGDINSHFDSEEWLENYARKFRDDLLAERDEIIQGHLAFCSDPDFAFLSFERPDICARACWKRRALAVAEVSMVRVHRETPQEYHRRKRQQLLDVLLETAETKATLDRWIEDQIADIEDEDEKERAREQFRGIAGNIIDDMNNRSEKRSSSPAGPEEAAPEEEADEEVY